MSDERTCEFCSLRVTPYHRDELAAVKCRVEMSRRTDFNRPHFLSGKSTKYVLRNNNILQSAKLAENSNKINLYLLVTLGNNN